MKKLINLALVSILVLGFSGLAQAQSDDTDTQALTITINEIKVLEIIGSAITLTITAPTVAGDLPQGDSDSSSLAQYTSVVAPASTHKITAQLDVAEPDGMTLTLTTSPPASCGTAVTDANLTNLSAVDVITAIAGCKTGSGGSDGATMAYSLNVTDPGGGAQALALDADSTAMVVTFTIL